MKTNRTTRAGFAQTGRIVKVTLDYRSCGLGDDCYRITRIVNEIAVCAGSKTLHVGDYLTEKEATDLLTEPGYEVSVVPAK